jgi:hypothetical protein
VTAPRLRVLMIGFFVAALVLTAIPEEQHGPMFAAGAACFFSGVLVFFAWRRAVRASVFARGEKTFQDRTE